MSFPGPLLVHRQQCDARKYPVGGGGGGGAADRGPYSSDYFRVSFHDPNDLSIWTDRQVSYICCSEAGLTSRGPQTLLFLHVWSDEWYCLPSNCICAKFMIVRELRVIRSRGYFGTHFLLLPKEVSLLYTTALTRPCMEANPPGFLKKRYLHPEHTCYKANLANFTWKCCNMMPWTATNFCNTRFV